MLNNELTVRQGVKTYYTKMGHLSLSYPTQSLLKRRKKYIPDTAPSAT